LTKSRRGKEPPRREEIFYARDREHALPGGKTIVLIKKKRAFRRKD